MPEQQTQRRCEGVCRSTGECVGEVRRVYVNQGTTNNSHVSNWEFWYCEEAIAFDRKSGFTVTNEPTGENTDV